MLVMETAMPAATKALKKYGEAVTAVLQHLLFLERIWGHVLRGERRRVNRRNASTTAALEKEMFRVAVAAGEFRQGIEATKETYGDADLTRLRELDLTLETVIRQWSVLTKRLQRRLDRGR